METARTPILVGMPLRGEWFCPNTPGSKVPSHGTNRLGTRYAYDFVQADWTRRGWPAYRGGLPRYLLRGAALQDYYCYGQPIYAPCDGVAVQAQDGWPERPRTSLLADTANAYKNAHSFDPALDDVRRVAGNFVILKLAPGVYAGLVHMQTGSVRVRAGQAVKKGELLGRVGHSGNSYMPHLHFQLMDSADLTTANGLPCAFERYEALRGGVWETVENGMPRADERIRFTENVNL